jgi:hypothetical protein
MKINKMNFFDRCEINTRISKEYSNTNLHKMKILHEDGVLEDATCYAASSHGNLEALIFLHENEYLHENKGELNEELLYSAAEYGNLECFKYIIIIYLIFLKLYGISNFFFRS